MEKRGKIAIAGGGIGGLSTAIALIEAGWDVTVFEKRDNVNEPGAGIQMTPNVTRWLLKNGLGPTLEEYGMEPAGQKFMKVDTGEVVKEVPQANAREKFGAPFYQIHRAHLKQGLLDRVEALARERGLGHVVVRTNQEVKGFEEDDEGARLKFADDSMSDRFDLVIGAEGLKSPIRQQIVGDENAKYTGHIAYRAVVDTEKLKDIPKNERLAVEMSVFMGGGCHVVLYYLDKGKLLNFVGHVEVPHENVTQRESWGENEGSHRKQLQKRLYEKLREDFKGCDVKLQHVIDAIDPEKLLYQELYDREPDSRYMSERGHVVLVGDSAHPMLPYLAQGAATAITGGIILARALDTAESIPEALRIYEATHAPYAAKMQLGSRASGDALHLAANGVIGKTTDRGWIYEANPETMLLIHPSGAFQKRIANRSGNIQVG